MSNVLLVYAVATAHGTLMLGVPLSAFLILRWRWFLWLHLLILLSMFFMICAQWPCPLTDLEKYLRSQAGLPVYDTYFTDYYFCRPLGRYGVSIWNTFNVLALVTAYATFFRCLRNNATA